jgi:Putative Flp pilus-assembly TadE/G-like
VRGMAGPARRTTDPSRNTGRITAVSFARRLFSAISRLVDDKRGASATIVAIALPGLIGFGALGAETGLWFTIKLRNQSAADAAAISAAYEVIAGKTSIANDLIPAAQQAAIRNGYKGITPAVIYPYSDDIVSNGIAVSLQQTQGALLAAMFLSDVTVGSKAVAVIEALDNPCVLALGEGGTDVEVTDLARLDMPNCSIATNSTSRSSIDLRGSTSSISAATLVTAGEVSFQGNPIDPAAPPPEFLLATPAMIGAPSVADPYAGNLTHSLLTAGMPTVSRCKSSNANKVRVYRGNCVIQAASLTQSRILLSADTQISGSWNIETGQTIDLSPGTYWITGDLTVAADGVLKCSTCDNARGTGVTIILTTQSSTIGTVSTSANATLNLNAPSSGRFSGLVMAQDSNGFPQAVTYTSSRSILAVGPAATLNGLVYFPNSSMTFHGSASATGPKCLLLVVKTLTVGGPSSLETIGCTRAGLTNLPAVSTVALAE